MGRRGLGKRVIALFVAAIMATTVVPLGLMAYEASEIENSYVLPKTEISFASYITTSTGAALAVTPFTGSTVVASGAFADGGGINGAPWRLYDCGLLEVDGGFIHWNNWFSPWPAQHRDRITNQIIFTAPITAGTSLRNLFRDLPNVTDIEGLCFFDTSSVTDMSDMFRGASGLTGLDLSGWDTRNVTDMRGMFWGASGLTSLDVSGWDTGSVTNMGDMFYVASGLTSLDLSGWDIGSVTNLGGMFAGASRLRQLTLSENFRFNADNPWLSTVPTNLIYTGRWQNVGAGTIDNPQGAHIFTTAQFVEFYRNAPPNLADTWVWQTTATPCECPVDCDCVHCLDCDCISIYCGAFADGGGIYGAPWRLYECGVLVVEKGFINWIGNAGSPWFTSRIGITDIIFTGEIMAGASLANLFRDLRNLTRIDGLQNFNTGSVTDMSRMFSWASGLTSLDLSGWDTSNVTNMNWMFTGTRGLTSLDVSGWDTGSVTNMGSIFANASGLTSLDLSGWDTGSVTSMSGMFHGASGLTSLDLSGWDTGNVTIMSGMFSDASGLTSIELTPTYIPERSIYSWDTGSVTNMFRMFDGASGLTSLDLSGWDTGSVTNMGNMFENASGLTSLDLSGWDTSSVTDMGWMFWNASGLTSLALSGWDTGSVTDMSLMFQGTRGLTGLDLSGWDTSSVTNMSGMFSVASGLTSLDLSDWDTSSVTDMQRMFSHASGLTSLDLSGWDTSSVTNMDNMFSHARGLTSLDLSGWDTSSVTNMGSMFHGANSLQQLTLGEDFLLIWLWLPSPPTNAQYTGRWQNVGTGTPAAPQGIHVLTSAQLVDFYTDTPPNLADTWVWQRVPPSPILTISTGSENPGGTTANVTLRMDNNPGFASMAMRLSFSDYLTLTGHTLAHESAHISELLYGFQAPLPGSADTFFGWGGRVTNLDVDGVLLTLNFDVAGNAPPKLLPVQITFENFVGDTEVPVNAAMEPLQIYIVNGGVLLEPVRIGDVDSNDSVNSLDTVVLARYLADHSVTINHRASDLDRNGDITGADLYYLLRWLFGRGLPPALGGTPAS